VPIETVRNREQGKRSPRRPARALLKLIEKAPQVAFAVLGPAKTTHWRLSQHRSCVQSGGVSRRRNERTPAVG
jgi:hypothetical protein